MRCSELFATGADAPAARLGAKRTGLASPRPRAGAGRGNLGQHPGKKRPRARRGQLNLRRRRKGVGGRMSLGFSPFRAHGGR